MTAMKPQPLSGLRPHPMNPKDHDKELLDASIHQFGFIEPVVVDARTGYLVSGHGRVESLHRMKDEGQTPPEGVKVTKGEWMVPTVTGWASKDDADAHAAMIALNRTTERGGWDEQQLLGLLQGLEDDDELMATVGYTPEEVRALERLVEADTTFTDLATGNAQVIDEFLDEIGDRDKVTFTYDTVLRVYFQTPEARTDFYEAIGYEPNEKDKTLRYPPSFQKGVTPEYTGDDE